MLIVSLLAVTPIHWLKVLHSRPWARYSHFLYRCQLMPCWWWTSTVT